MSENGKDISGGGTATIEEELSRWPEPVNTKVAEAASKARKTRQEAMRKKRDRSRLFLLLTGMLILISAGLGLLLWRGTVRPEPSKVAAAPTPQPPPNLEHATFKVVPQEGQAGFYEEVDATVSDGSRDILYLVKLDFFASKFIRDNTALQNQLKLVEILRGRHDSFDGQWVLIFVGASIEGSSDYNKNLCEERLYAIRQMMHDEASLAAKEYWGIRGGECKVSMPGVRPEDEDDAEETLAHERGGQWLADQRRLIVVGIKQVGPLLPQDAQRVPFVVAQHLYNNDLMPRNYDSSGMKPFLLEPKAAEERRRHEQERQ